MTDIALLWSNSEAVADLVLAGDGDLATDEGLTSAVIISLFTDARARDEDVLPDTVDALADRRGWWGDEVDTTPGDRIGSRLWLLDREKRLPSVLQRARAFADESLAWLVEDGVAKSVAVSAELRGTDQIALSIEIERPDGRPRHRSDFVWDAIEREFR